MKTIHLAQSSDYTAEVVGQRVIISDEELAERQETPGVSNFTGFMYLVGGLVLLVLAVWAIQNLLKADKPSIKPLPARPVPKALPRTRKIAKP